MVIVSYPQKIDICHRELFCRSIKEAYPPFIVLLDFKRDYAASSMKSLRRLDFLCIILQYNMYYFHFTLQEPF